MSFEDFYKVPNLKFDISRLREDLTSTNDLYEESDRKIFNPPVSLECLVEWNQSEVKTSKFDFNKKARGGFIKTGDGDKFVKKAYGGRVGS